MNALKWLGVAAVVVCLAGASSPRTTRSITQSSSSASGRSPRPMKARSRRRDHRVHQGRQDESAVNMGETDLNSTAPTRS